MITNQQRAHRAGKAIAHYGDDIEESNLIDLLADAMHWCQQNGRSFHMVLARACCHFVNELRDERQEDRKKI